MSEFDEIRPYNDDEVPQVLQNLLADNEFLDAVIKLKIKTPLGPLRHILRFVVKSRLKKEAANIKSVADFQARIENYLVGILDDSSTKFTVSGIDQLDPDKAYLFISNHRDIAMDPALTNLAIYRAGFTTLRIAIGDNLLTKPSATHLMRLNKSFIVNRSVTAPREKLKAAKLLSKYIHHSVVNDNENVWIAQREGRAKDGIDRTNSAIISMLSYSKPKSQSLSEYIREANIVPVSISYEYDPCDMDKARELYVKDKHGNYQKEEHEDVQSIVRGITGFKGAIHVAFGEPLSGEYENSDDVTAAIDTAILENYRLFPSNCIAYEMLEKKSPLIGVGEKQTLFTTRDFSEERRNFNARLEAIAEKYHPNFLASYANPVRDKLNAR
jgi:hypothetical protein